jgi:septum formation protein
MLYLASQSPRRRELLTQLGLAYGVLDVHVAEQQQPDEPALDFVNRVAREKAGAGLLEVVAVADAVVLGADTEVVLDDVVFGKPADAEDAARMLAELSGRSHRVITAVWLVSAAREEHIVCQSEVRFAPLSKGDIASYVETGECLGKAGAYAVQGRAAAFIEHLSGSYSGVMGLPLYETSLLLRKFAIQV